MHVVQIRDRELLHVHERHDVIALLLRGRGTLRVGSETVRMKPGSVVAIQRAVPHAFVNESRQPAAAFVVFTPPFDGKDTVLVQE
jgi:mannose-6-phosphate isomerase-like protein (cupin superfamily)